MITRSTSFLIKFDNFDLVLNQLQTRLKDFVKITVHDFQEHTLNTYPLK